MTPAIIRVRRLEVLMLVMVLSLVFGGARLGRIHLQGATSPASGDTFAAGRRRYAGSTKTGGCPDTPATTAAIWLGLPISAVCSSDSSASAAAVSLLAQA